MKLNQQNKTVRFVLRAIDVIVATFGHGRLPRRIRWNEDPFQKATEEEKHYAGLFMAFIPIFFLVFFANMKSFGSWVDSMMYGHHSIVWLYLSAFILIGGIGGILFAVGPKTPLFVSVPVAVVMWPILLWFVWKHLI